MDRKTPSLPFLPYDVLHLIFTQLEKFRAEACKPPRGRPEIPTNTTQVGFAYYRPLRQLAPLPPKKPHDSPRRAEKWRIDHYNATGSSGGENAAPAPFEGASIFDGLSRTCKALRELCAPYIFKNVVLASDDCLTLDRIEFYASEKAEWMLKHIRSFRLMATNVTWPNSLGSRTPDELYPAYVSTLIRLIHSIPYLKTLDFIVEPRGLVSEFKHQLTTAEPPITFPTVKSVYINTDNEYILPLLSSPEAGGLEAFEYTSPHSIKSPNKVTFSTIGASIEEKETGLFGGMPDARAVGVIKGLSGMKMNNSLRKITLAAFISDSGIVEMAKAGILENVRELVLLYGVASSCASSLSHLPNLRYIRFGQDDVPISAKNPHCYMSRRELLTVARNATKMEEVWHRNRFVCHVKRLVGEGYGGTEIDENETWWMDTWAPDGVGNKNVISGGWLG
ncbi:hypothetical protein TWF730_000261 [Orbilia blumenaviensis]|uniref:Uncharacterized protein n=1 Tax=Orbilia blumenaviensis TaxID=1796055 RepID=A0AAV9VNB1_9PEZI